jgi:hypothetical protein
MIRDLIIENGKMIIVLDDKRFLVDTGFAYSIGEIPEITVGDKNYKLNKSGEIAEANANLLFKEPVCGYIGMDILSEHYFEFKKKEGKVYIDEAPSSFSSAFALHLDSAPYEGSNLLYSKLAVNGMECPLVIDSGSAYTYLHHSFTDALEASGQMRDWNPRMLMLEAPTFDVNIEFDGFKKNVNVARMPLSIISMSHRLDTKCFLSPATIDSDVFVLDVKNGKAVFAN